MPRRLVLVPTIVTVLCALFTLSLMAQSKSEGDRLFQEARGLQEKAQTVDDLKRAVEKYEAALKIFETVKFDEGIGATLTRLGRIHAGWNQYNGALEYYEKALEHARRAGNGKVEVQGLLGLAKVSGALGQHVKAVELCEKSLELARKIGDERGEGEVLNSLGNACLGTGQHAKALEFFEKSLELARKHRNERDEGEVLNSLGNACLATGQYAKALEFYENALELAKKLGTARGEGQVLNNLGQVYRNWGQYDRAMEYFEKSLALSQALKDPREEARILNSVGWVYAQWGKYDKSVKYYERVLDLHRELKNPRGEAGILHDLGMVYATWGQYDKAVEYYERSLAISRGLKNPSGEAGALQSLGGVYYGWGQYDKAVEYYEQSLAISREIKNPRGEGSTLSNLGLVFFDRGQYDKAVEYYERSLAISRGLKNPSGEAGTLNRLGLVYWGRGRYDKAVEYYELSIGIMKELKDPRGEATALNNLGLVYAEWGQYEKAVEHFDRSLAMRKELKLHKEEGTVLGNFGRVYAAWGQYDKAVEYYEKSLAISRELKDPRGEGRSLSNLGNVYAAQGRYTDALVNLRKALDIYKAIGVPIRWQANDVGNLYLDIGEVKKAEPFIKEGKHYAALGRLSLIKGDYASARKNYEKLLGFAEKNRNVNNLFTAYTGLGTIYEATGDDKKAEEYFLKAVNLTEELRSTLPKAERETFFDVRINGFLRTAPYDGVARIRIRMNRPQDAFKDSEYTKSRIFAETMSKWSEGTSFDIPADVLTQDQQLNDQLSALRNKRQEAYEKANQEVIKAIDPQVKQMEDKLWVHIKMIREKYPIFAATKYPEPMDLKQTAIKENEWILAYHVTDPGIIIYLTKGKEIVKALFKPFNRNDLDSLILTFRRPLEIIPGRDKFDEKLKSFDLAAGKRLSDLLLSDILDKLPRNVPVHIVPDDSLGMLPFEMLVLNDSGSIKTDKDLPYISGADFFGDRNLLSYCQSVTALTLSRIHAKSKAKEVGLLAVTDPVFHEKDERTSKAPKKEAPTSPFASLCKRLGLMAAENDPQMGGLKFQRLSLTGELGKALADMHEKDSHICTGFDASKSNFLDTIAPQLNRYDKVVFATHGYFGKDLPGIMEPVLVLTLVPSGTDGFLRMTEVMGLNMNADIVALTACQTGLGKRTAGEGTMGMGRAFQYAGAKSVLMSLWSVSEFASVNMVKSFFRHLKDGTSKSEALASARDEIRKRGFDHPFFWAAFILVGETN